MITLISLVELISERVRSAEEIRRRVIEDQFTEGLKREFTCRVLSSLYQEVNVNLLQRKATHLSELPEIQFTAQQIIDQSGDRAVA